MPVSLYKGYSTTNGFGAFTPQPIEKGDIISVWDGPYAEKLPESDLAKYYLYVRPNKWLIGFGGEYPESFINHSCDPNSKVTWEGDIATLTSIRCIEPNEEITFDYETVTQSDDSFIFNCGCGASNCRKVIRIPTCSL
ncbi:MAG: SET domain-containing protein-lysine N-methyltransferase [Candidatus Bathyarchaeia archaeon]|jgi:hypothetical protein